MIRDKYEKILDQFELYYPSMFKDAVDWWVSGRMMICVRLTNGEIYEFNRLDNSIRKMSTMDEYIEDEEIRKKALGHNLQKLIPFSGMTQSEIAKRLGITDAMMSRYIHGVSMPSADKVHLLAMMIGCRVDELFDATYSE